jgi:MFS family permease
VLVPVLGIFSLGLVVTATAPTMPIVLLGQFLQGAGGGGLYALSLGTVAKTYPDRLRPRVLALLATMWILPGLIGPPVGATIASTVGWRWAFVAPIPVLLATWALIAPVLDLVPRPEVTAGGLSLRWPLQLMVGAAFVFASITVFAWWVPAAVAVGLAIGVPALRRIAPPGTFRAAPGQGAIGASAFLLSVSFLAMDAFLTLMLTRVRGLSLAAAGAAISVATVSWAAGALWQSNRAGDLPLNRLVGIGASLVFLGQAAVASTLWIQVPLAVAYVGWGAVGAGMGIAFATIPLAAMRVSGAGEEGEELSSVLLMDMLGVATGAGLGGAAIALSDALGAPLRSGLAGAFALALAAALVLLSISRRIPSGPVEVRPES